MSGLFAQLVFPFGAQLGLVCATQAQTQGIRMMRIVQALERHQTTGGANREIGGVVDQSADLEQIVEDGGIDGAGEWGVVVDVGEGFEDLGGELEPWSMERRDVAPMPVLCKVEKVSKWT